MGSVPGTGNLSDQSGEWVLTTPGAGPAQATVRHVVFIQIYTASSVCDQNTLKLGVCF